MFETQVFLSLHVILHVVSAWLYVPKSWGSIAIRWIGSIKLAQGHNAEENSHSTIAKSIALRKGYIHFTFISCFYLILCM